MVLLKVFTKRCKTVAAPFNKKGQLRFIALILSILFAQNTIAFSAPSIQTTTFSENANFLESFKIPESLATVESKFNPTNPAFHTPILYIQDAHAHPEAQKNIQLLLEHLAGQKKLKAIALESAVGKVDPSTFRFFPVPEANQAVYEDLAAHGELTGAELFALSQKVSSMPLVGVDDLGFYRKSYAAYQKVISFKAPVQRILDLYAAEIEKIMARLPVDLGKMLRAELAWDGGVDHLEYFHTLRDLSLKHLKLDFSDAQNQFNWPNLTRLMIAERMQNSVKPEYLSGETRQLVELLNERIKNTGTRRFLTEGLVKMGDARAGKDFHVWLVMNKTNTEIKSTRVFMEHLHDQARKAGISLINYPVLMDWAGLFILQEEVNASKLIEETNKVKDLLEAKIVRANNEKQILELIKDFQTVKKLLALKLTRENHARFLARRSELSGTAFQKRFSKFSKKKLPRLPKGLLKHAEIFYQLSEQRDQALFENTLKLSADQKKSGQAIALIAGGFHTSGLKSLFEKNQVPYLTLTPHMSFAGDESLYEKVMMGKNSADENLLPSHNLGAWLLLKPEPKLPKRLLDRQTAVPGRAIRRSAAPVLRAKGWNDERIQQSLEKLSPKKSAASLSIKTAPQIQFRLNTLAQAGKTHPVLYWLQRATFSRSEVRSEGAEDAGNYGNVIWQIAQTEETLYYSTHPKKEPELNAGDQYWEAQQYLRDLYNTIADFAKANEKSSYGIQVKDAFYAKLLKSENIAAIIESVIPAERRESGYLDQLDIFRILAKLRGKSFIPLYPQYAVPNVQPSYRIGLLVDPSKSTIEPLLFRELLGDPSVAVDVIVGMAPYQFYLTLNSSRYREFLPAGSVAYNDKENWVSILGKKITVIKNASQLSKEEWEAKHLHGFAATYNASAQINELADTVSVSKRAKAGEQAAHIRLLSVEDSNPFKATFPTAGPDKTTYSHGMESTRRLQEKNLVLSPSLAHVPAKFYQEVSGLSVFKDVETYFSLDYALAPYLTQPPLDKSGRLKSGLHNQVMASPQAAKYLESSVQNAVSKVGSKKNVAKGVRISSVPVGVGDRVKISLKILGRSSINKLLINLGLQKKTKGVPEEDLENQIKDAFLKVLEKKFSAPESLFSMKYSRGLVNTDARLEKKILVDSRMTRVNMIRPNQGTSALEIDVDLVFNREYQDAQQLLKVLNEVGIGVTANLPPIGVNVDERYSPYGKQIQMAHQNQTIPPAPLEIPEKIEGLTPRPLRLGVLAPHGQVGFAGLRSMGYFLNLAAVAGTGPNLSELTHAVQMESVQGPFLSHRVEVPIEVKPNEGNQNGGDVLGEVQFGDGNPFTLLRRYGTPNEIPWAKFGVDFVVDGSGEFDDPTDPASILGHLSAGRNKDTGAAGAFLTAPFTSSPANPDEIKQFSTIVYPLNLAAIQKQFSNDDVARIVSNASCTTNCAALMTEWGNRFQKATTKLLRETYGIPEAELTGVQISQATTVHAPTNTQQVIDAAIANDLKNASRLRSAAGSIQTSSGVSKAIKQLGIKGNPWPLAFTGFAVRVGLSTTSLVYMPAVFSVKGLSEESRKKLVENKADLEKNLVKAAEKTAKAMASDPQFKDAVRFAAKDEAFTSEIIVGSKDGAIFDGQQIQALFQPESDLIAVNLLGWYDNVNGYMWQASRTLNEVAKEYFAKSEVRSSSPILENIEELFSIDLNDPAQKAIYEPYMAVLEAADKYSRYWVTASNGRNNRVKELKNVLLNSKNRTKTSMYLSKDIFLPMKGEPNGIQAYWSMLEAILKSSEHDKQDEQTIMALFHSGLLGKSKSDVPQVSPDEIGSLLNVAALLKTEQRYKKFVPFALTYAPVNYSSRYYFDLESHLSTSPAFLDQFMKEFMNRFSYETSAQSGIKGLIRLLESVYRHGNLETKKLMYRIFWGNVTYKDLSLGTVLNGHQLSLEELLKSTLFIKTGTPRRKNLVQEKIARIAKLKSETGEPVFRKMIEYWGFDAVSIWAEKAAKDSSWVQKRKELFEIISSINPTFNDPIPAAFLMLELANKKRPDLMGLAIELLEEAHELEEHIPDLLKIISRHTPYAQDPVTHHAEDYEPLIAYLFTLKKITGANYIDSPSSVTELLYGGTGRVYYLANKLAGLMTRADLVDFKVPRKLALDMDPRDQDNQLFHYIRVKIHRETNKHDLDVVYLMMKALMLANLEEETNQTRDQDLEKIIHASIFKEDLFHKAQFAKDVLAGARSQLGKSTGKYLAKMLGQNWDNLSKEAILRADVSTFKEGGANAEDRTAHRYASLLIELYQNLYLYYEGSLESAGKSTRSQYQNLTREQIIAKMEEIEQKRLLNKEKLTQRFEFSSGYGIPEPKTYAQLHDPDPRDKYNFPDVGTWTDYHEPKYDAFKQDQKDSLIQDGLFDEFISNRLPIMIKEVRTQIQAETPETSGDISSEASNSLKLIFRVLELFNARLDLEGFSVNRLKIYSRILNERTLTIHQAHNLFSAMMGELYLTYDFYREKFGTFSKQIALSAGRPGVLDVYLRQGEDQLTEQDWAYRVQETFIGSLRAEDKGVVFLEQLLEGVNGLLEELKPYYKKQIRSGKGDDFSKLVTIDNFDSAQQTPLEMGSKGYELMRLYKGGFPVPALATLTTSVWAKYQGMDTEEAINRAVQDTDFRNNVLEAILNLEKLTGQTFHFESTILTDTEKVRLQKARLETGLDPKIAKPLFISVRSGALPSMPGIMDTVINLPMNEWIIQDLIDRGEDPQFVYDVARRFLDSFGRAYYGVDSRELTRLVDLLKERHRQKKGISVPVSLSEFSADEMKEVFRSFLLRINAKRRQKMSAGTALLDSAEDPLGAEVYYEDSFTQVLKTVAKIFASWTTSEAKEYRKMSNLSEDFGTAVNLVQMVFGNRGKNSGTGIIFTRNPDNGSHTPSGDIRKQSQGPDLVGGRTGNFMLFSEQPGQEDRKSLEQEDPNLYQDIMRVIKRLSEKYKNRPLDVEITWDESIVDPETGRAKIYILQVRPLRPTKVVGQKKLKLPAKVNIENSLIAKGLPVSANATIGRLLDARGSNYQEYLQNLAGLRKEMDVNGEQGRGIILVMDYATDEDALKIMGGDAKHFGVQGLINGGISASSHAALTARDAGIAFVGSVKGMVFRKDAANNSQLVFNAGSLDEEAYEFGMNGPLVAIDGYSSLVSPTGGMILLASSEFKLKDAKKTVDSSAVAPQAQPRSEVRGNNIRKKRLPDVGYAQDVLDQYKLKLNSLKITSLTKSKADKNLLRGVQFYAAMTAGLETLAPYWLHGQGVGRDKKEITQIKTQADGMAVAIRIQMLLAAVAKDQSFAIVVRGDEGGRDESYSLEVGGIYWGGYEGGFKSFKVETPEGMKALEKEIQKLREKRIRVLGHVGDALDGTTPLVEGKFGSTTVLGWSSGFDFFVPDDLRAGGIIANLPYAVPGNKNALLDSIKDPAADFKTIVAGLADFYGVKKDSVTEQVIWTFLGPKGGKDWTEDKHEQLIVDTQNWKGSSENKTVQLPVVTPSDGNVPFVALAAAGVTAFSGSGKKQRWVAIGRSGFPEAIASGLIVAANSGGQAVLRVVSKVGTDAVYSSKTVDDYNQSERVLMSALKVPQTHLVARKKYQGIFTMGSINGLDRNQVGAFADILQGVRIDEKKRTLKSDVFFSTPQGNFVLHFEFLSDDLDATKEAFLNAPSFLAAPKTQPKSEVRWANLSRESLQPVAAEALKLNRGLSSMVFVAGTAARKVIDPELINADTLAAWELLMFGGNAVRVNDASEEMDLRLTPREASKEAARTVVLVDTGSDKGITPEELNAMELASGSRLVVLESQQASGKTWNGISKIKLPGNITPARLSFEGALPTEAEISKALKQSPGNIPVVVFPELTSDEVLAEYQNVSSQEGFVVSMPKNKEARFAFSYLLGHSLPGTLLKDVPSDDLLKVALRSDALSRAYVPVWAEGRFAQWAIERMRDRLFAQAA